MATPRNRSWAITSLFQVTLADNLNPNCLKLVLTSHHISPHQKGHRTSCLTGLKLMVLSQGQMGCGEVTGTGNAQGLPALQDKGQILGVNFSFSPSVLLSSAVPNVILERDKEFISKQEICSLGCTQLTEFLYPLDQGKPQKLHIR